MEKKEIIIGIINEQGYLHDNKLHRGVAPTLIAQNDKVRVLKKWKKSWRENMLIVAKQGFEYYAIFDTIYDKFIGVNLDRDTCASMVAQFREQPLEYGYERVDRCQPFKDIAKALEDDEED